MSNAFAAPRPHRGRPSTLPQSTPHESRPSTPDESHGPQQADRRRRLLTAAVVAVLVAAGIWFLTQEGKTLHDLARAADQADPWWLAPAFAATALSYLGYALLYQAVARVDGGPRPPLRLALRLTVAIFGASVIATAAGRLGGEYWSLRRMRERPALAWARVLAINTAAWAIITALAAIGALVLLAPSTGHRAPLGLELAWLAALPVCLPPALYLSSPSRRHLAEDRGGRIRRTAASVINALVLLRKLAAARPARHRALAGAIVYWGAELLVLWAALRGFGVDVGYGPLVVGYATGFVSTMLPLPAGGVGGVEAASVYALTLVGVPLGPALLAVLVQRVLTYWLPLAVALVGARFLRSLPADLAAVPAGAPA